MTLGGAADLRLVAGVDGARGGWLVALRAIDDPRQTRVLLVPAFADVLALDPAPVAIAIDIPIGLPERGRAGGRVCDVAARTHLGARQSSVFAVPSRAAVMCADYGSACAAALATSDPPRKVSKQAFNLFPKIREVDRLMTPALQRRVMECHPELAFVLLNGGRALEEPKKVKSQPYAPGLSLRRDLLTAAGYDMSQIEAVAFRKADVGADDVIDAVALSWSAARIVRGDALCCPADPPLDSRGLRMEIRA
ncbi:MAG: DUF429 domain-containing protein [Hyphomicrobiaceae bacterium]